MMNTAKTKQLLDTVQKALDELELGTLVSIEYEKDPDPSGEFCEYNIIQRFIKK